MKKRGTCYICGSRYHYKANCPKNSDNIVKCRVCNITGHSEWNCEINKSNIRKGHELWIEQHLPDNFKPITNKDEIINFFKKSYIPFNLHTENDVYKFLSRDYKIWPFNTHLSDVLGFMSIDQFINFIESKGCFTKISFTVEGDITLIVYLLECIGVVRTEGKKHVTFKISGTEVMTTNDCRGDISTNIKNLSLITTKYNEYVTQFKDVIISYN